MCQSYMSEKVSLERTLGALFETALEAEVRWEGIPLLFCFSLDNASSH